MDAGDYDTLKLAYDKIAEIDKEKEISRSDWKKAIDFMWPMLDVNKNNTVTFCEAKNGFRLIQAYETGLQDGMDTCSAGGKKGGKKNE